MIELNKKNQKLSIIGTGFLPGIKVMIQGLSLIPVSLKDGNTLELTLPEIKEKGKRTITIIQHDGSTLEIPEAFEV